MNKENNNGLGNPLVAASVASVVGKVAPYAIGAGVVYFTYKQLFPDDKHESIKRDKYWHTDEFGVKYNAIDIAANYRAAMDGAGTEEQSLFELAKLSRGSRFSNISKAFFAITQKSLLARLQSELSSTHLATYNAIRNNKPSNTAPKNTVHYEFAVGETVALKSNTTLYKVVVQKNGKWVFQTMRFPLAGMQLGKILNRKQFRKAGTNDKTDNFYTTEDYPNIYIIGVALQRYDGYSWIP